MEYLQSKSWRAQSKTPVLAKLFVRLSDTMKPISCEIPLRTVAFEREISDVKAERLSWPLVIQCGKRANVLVSGSTHPKAAHVWAPIEAMRLTRMIAGHTIDIHRLSKRRLAPYGAA